MDKVIHKEMPYQEKCEKKTKKILLVSHTISRPAHGAGLIVKRLFECFPKDSYIVFTSQYEGNYKSVQEKQKLSCRYYFANLHSIFKTYTRTVAILEWLEVLPAVLKGLNIVRKEKISDFFVIPTGGNFLLTAYFMHLLSGKPLSIYFLDLFAGNKDIRLRRWLSVPVEYLAVYASSNIFVMSENLKKHYDKKYNIESFVLPHPVKISNNIKHTRNEYLTKRDKGDDSTNIVFTGHIYNCQDDCLRNLAKTVNHMKGIQLHIYTPRPKAHLDKLGITGRNVKYHGFVDQEEIYDIQRNADILFLPHTFSSDPILMNVTRTASPAKLPEYLNSETPILVHAPEYAYISWYARKYGWGVVVDKPTPKLLKEAILKLLNDKTHKEGLVKNALSTAQMHEDSNVSAILLRELGMLKT